MSTSEPEKPKRPRRRKKPASEAPEPAFGTQAETGPATEPARAGDEAEEALEETRAGSDADAAPQESADEPKAKPARRRRRAPAKPKAEAEPAEAEAGAEADEVEATAEDVEAEEATEVVLEADDEAEGEPEAPAEPARPPASAPRRRSRGERPPGPPPVVRAQAKYVRSSARKARLVCDHIRGKSVEDARAILAHTPRAIARDWSKLLESAVANAENNHELVGEDLYVKAVHADEGPTIRRFRPRAMGRATRIRKRTSHLTILLTPKSKEAGGRTSSSKRGAGRPAED
jgi:ribosomal protein L22